MDHAQEGHVMLKSGSIVTRLTAGVIVINLFVIALMGVFLYQNYRHYAHETAISTQNLVRSLELNVAGIIDKVDGALFAVVQETERQIAHGGIDESALTAYLEAQQARLPELDALRITEATGDVRYGVGVPESPRVNVSDREYFSVLHDQLEVGMLISKPVQSRINGRWVLPIARRVNFPDGSFAGVAYGAITLDYFQTVFAALDIGKHGAISLRDEELGVIARCPEPGGVGSAIGNKDVSITIQESVRTHPNFATYVAVVKLDNLERTISYRKVGRYPLYIFVGQAMRDYLIPWRKEAAWTCALAALFTAGTICSAWLIFRKWQSDVAAAWALRESEAKFRSYIDSSPDGVFVADEHGRYLEVNQAASRITGYAAAELVGMSIPDVLPPEAVAAGLQYFHTLKATGSASGESEFRHKNGTIRWWSVDAVKLSDTRFLGFTKDITARKQAEQELVASQIVLLKEQAFKRLLLDTSPAFIVAIDLHGNTLMMNRSMLDVLGYAFEEVRGVPYLTTFVPEEDRNAVTEVFNRIVKEGACTFSENRIISKTGQTYLVQWHGRFVTSNNDANFFVGIGINITERKQAEEDLQKSEVRLRTLIDTIPDLIWLKDPDGVYLQCNQRFEKLYGAKEAEIVGKTDYDFVDRKLADFFRRNDLAAIAAGKPTMNEEQVTYADDGHTEYLETIKTPIYSNEGQFIGVLGIGRDITERKRTEEALRQSQQLLAMTFASLHDAIFIVDADKSQILDCNPRASEMFGYAREQMLGRTTEFLHVDKATLDEFRRHLRQAVEEHGSLRAFEFRMKRKDGTVFPTEHNVIPLGQSLGWVSVVSDITERKRAEEALRETEAQYRFITENTTDVIWTLSFTTGKFTYVSPAIQKLRGYTPEEVLNQTMAEAITPESLQRVTYLLQQGIAQRQPGDTGLYKTISLVDQPCKDGSVVSTEVATTLIFDEHGQLVEIIGVSRDITERKRVEAELQRYREHLEDLVAERTEALEQEILKRKYAEQALQEAKDAADAANRAKSIFLANMSHELRTPLNAILGFSQLLARDQGLSPTQQNYLGIINRSGEHLLKLINDVLDMSKIEAGQMTLQLTSFDLWQMLDNIEEMIRVRTTQKGLALIVTRAPDVPQYITTDESKLRQVLINLLSNAVKFTEAGRIELRIKNEELGMKKQPQIIPNSSFLILNFSVADTGIGIAPDEMTAIFEAFHQGSAGQRNPEGTGLGLTISRQCVRLLGGDITVMSTPGSGSVFTFDIAVSVPEQADNRTPRVVSPQRVLGLVPHQPVYRVLVAEDHEESRILLTHLFTAVGFEVAAAQNGQEALERWAAWQPHLIFMDMRMPVMDGYEATKAIRNEELRMKNEGITAKHQTPIVALTASSFAEQREEILRTGCDDVIYKPFQEQEIFEITAKYLGVRYVYEEGERQEAQGARQTAEKVLTPEALSAIPVEMLAHLEGAILQGDIDLIAQVIETIRAVDEKVAETLALLTQRFEYDRLLALLQLVKGETHG
jgi:two-component system sensor histidine kinase/response regulator